ncbi:MAG: glutathione synthase [Hyphomicrobiaceae bacterium]
MPLNIAMQMDPIEHIDIRGDSSFALLLEAQKRGHGIYYYTPAALTFAGGKVVANGASLEVADEIGAHFGISSPRRAELAEFDSILLRQDPPFDMGYITTTHLLERIHPQTLVVNNPAHVRNAPEKIFVLDYPDLMPPTMVTRSLAEVKAFREAHGDIIIKPLYGNGGAAVFSLRPDDTNLNALVEMFHQMAPEPFMVQQYRDEVRAGDKRIILIDGEIAGAINRVPAADEARSNMHVGGKAEPVDLTDRDREICERLKPELKTRGLIFTGIDVIGDYLTEINVTSPTGIREIARFGGNDIAAMIWDVIEEKCAK